MVTSTAGLACDTSATNKENRETRNSEANPNEYNELKKKPDDKSIINPIEKIATGTQNNDISNTMSNNKTSVNNELNTGTEGSSLAVAPALSSQSSEPLTNGGISSPNGNIPVPSFANTSHSNYGTYNASSLSHPEKPGQNAPGYQASMQSRFSGNQPSSATPTLNQLLATPARFPSNIADTNGPLNSQSQPDITRAQRQSWDQDTTQQSGRAITAVPNPDPSTGIPLPVSQPQQQSDYYPPPRHSFPPSQHRYPAPAGHQIPPYTQAQQYNPNMPPPSGSPYPPSQHTGNPYQNPSQSHYYGRHTSPGQVTSMGSPRNVPPPLQHPSDPSFQYPKDRMMSPNRRTPQPSAVPSPMSAGSSPHMQGQLPSVPHLHNQSPSRGSPALAGTPNATPLSPNLIRPGTPQQAPTVRGADMQDSRPPSTASGGYTSPHYNNAPQQQLNQATGYPNSYRPTTPRSPYPSQGPSTPQSIISPTQTPYSGPQQHTNIPAPMQGSLQVSAPPSDENQMQPVSSAANQPYHQAGQQQPISQQPGGYTSPHYNNAPQQQLNQGYNPSTTPTDRRPSSEPGSVPPSAGDPGQSARRGAAAAAAAAMAAAAHSAQPGHVSGQQRYPAPNYYATPPQQQLRAQHPNYSNMQPSSDSYQLQKPYSQVQPRMPASASQHQVPNPGIQNTYKMHPHAPPSSSYRHQSMPPPPHQYPGQHPPNSGFSNPLPSGYPSPFPSHEKTTKKTSTRGLGASQKLSALFEPANEPGRREFVEGVLRYWEEKDLPLKNAPLMGKKTLDLFRLYHLVKQNGGMQEVTGNKKWPEISTILGLGTASSSGFTLKKQYCKYLYGYECRVERGQAEPQEARARFTEAHRKKKQAIENARDDARVATMPLHAPPAQHGGAPPQSYPPQHYPQGNYPYQHQYRAPPPQPAGVSQGYIMPRTVAPSMNSYPGYPSTGSTAHANMPPSQSYSQPVPSSYGQWPQGQQAVATSTYPSLGPAALASQPLTSLLKAPSQGLATSIATSSQPIIQQQPSLPVPASANSSIFPSALTTSTSTFTAALTSSNTSRAPVPTSQQLPPIPIPVTYYQSSGTAPPYSYTPTNSYRPLPSSLMSSSYPGSKSPLPNVRQPSSQPYLGPSLSPSPRQTMSYLPKSASPFRPSPPRTPNFPTSTSPGLKRPAIGGVGPPNKIFHHDDPNSFSPGSPSPRRAEHARRHRSSLRYPGTSSSPLLRSVPAPQRGPYPQRLPQYRNNNANTYRYPNTRPLQRWPRSSTTSRVGSPMPFSTQKYQLNPRASLRRQFVFHRSPMSQQFKREYMYFPPNSVEATPLRLAKFQRKTSGNVGLVEGWRIIMALKSGLMAESSWALNVLNIFLYDQRSVAQFRLSQLPGLLDALTEHYRRYLMEIFCLPSELKALGACNAGRPTGDTAVSNDSADEDTALIKQLRLISKKKTDMLDYTKLSSKFVKQNIKVEPRGNPFIVDKSHQWGHFEEKLLIRDLSHIVISLDDNTVKKPEVKTDNERNSTDQPPALDITLEDLLSIPCTILCPDVYDVMKSSIEIMESEEKEMDKIFDSKTDAEDKEMEEKSRKASSSSEQDASASIKSDPTSPDVKIESPSHCQVSEKEMRASPSVKIEQLPSLSQHPTTKVTDKPTKLPENDKDSGEIKKNNVLVNGVKEESLTDSETITKQTLQHKSSCENHTKQDITCKMEVDDASRPHLTSDVNSTVPCKVEVGPYSESEVDPTCKSETGVTCKQTKELDPQPKIELSDDTKTDVSQEANAEVDSKSELNPVSKHEIMAECKSVVKEECEPEVALESGSKAKDINTKCDPPNLVTKVKQIMEERNVLLVEDESFGRDGSSSDPLSGPLLCSKTSLSRTALSNRLQSLSNILRSISFIPKNMVDICQHPGLMRALSGVLLLRHKHRRKRKRKLDFDEKAGSKEEDIHTSNEDGVHQKLNNHDLENKKCRFQKDNSEKVKPRNFTTETANSPTSFDVDIDEVKEHSPKSSSLFAPKTTSEVEAETSSKKFNFSSVVLNENKKEEEEVFNDTWWWDAVQRIREDALIILSNVAPTLDLSIQLDNHAPLAIIEACIHLILCTSSDACESFSQKPRHDLSAQRLSLEILSKLSIKDENVQLIVAIRPFSKLEKLFTFLINLVSDRKDQVLQEFAIVLLSNLSRNDPNISRIIALQNSSIFCLIAFLEACEETAMNNRQLLRLQPGVTHCGTTEFIMCKAARALLAMASVTENKPKFIKYQLRLLALSMSQLLGSQVTAVISSILFELTHETT